MFSYDELIKMKEKGQKLDFDNITKEQLEKLFYENNYPDSMIADLYDVEPNKVKNKRYKWDIKLNSPKNLYTNYINNNHGLFDRLNSDSKERLMKEENIEWLSKALTHYLFRNGPVEDMHANRQLSQSDMKTLNKYMVNRIAGLLKLICDGEWFKIELLFNSLVYRYCGSNWDKPEYDTEEIDFIFNSEFDLEEDLVKN